MDKKSSSHQFVGGDPISFVGFHVSQSGAMCGFPPSTVCLAITMTSPLGGITPYQPHVIHMVPHAKVRDPTSVVLAELKGCSKSAHWAPASKYRRGRNNYGFNHGFRFFGAVFRDFDFNHRVICQGSPEIISRRTKQTNLGPQIPRSKLNFYLGPLTVTYLWMFAPAGGFGPNGLSWAKRAVWASWQFLSQYLFNFLRQKHSRNAWRQ